MSQWISPQFSIKFSNVLDNLFITDRVELGDDKSNSELENIYREKINNSGRQNTAVDFIGSGCGG